VTRRIRLPFFDKDLFKEMLSDELGTGDMEWKRKLGGVSYSLLFHVAERALARGSSVVIESNFYTKQDLGRLQLLNERHAHVLLARYRARLDRHPGHLDEIVVGDVTTKLAEGAWNISGKTIVIDTTDFANVDVEVVTESIRQSIAAPQAEAK
jgi:hypothetical protein